jgi:hypothetical protein
MPRDFARNLYVTVGIPRESQMYQALCQEMAETGLALSQVIAVRLADYYRSGTLTMRGDQEPLDTANTPLQGQAEPFVTEERTNLEARAREAAIAWAVEEEP